jgi:WhiB family redox-sensing transcriptional regulator
LSKAKFDSIDIPKFIFDGEPLCSQTDPEIFFQQENNYGRHAYLNEKEAKDICRACPLVSECLIYALKSRDSNNLWVQGIWGGTTERDRQKIRDSKGFRRQ